MHAGTWCHLLITSSLILKSSTSPGVALCYVTIFSGCWGVDVSGKHTHWENTHRVWNEAGAETLSTNCQAGRGLFNQDILQLREECMNEPEKESPGRDTQASQPQTLDTHCHSTLKKTPQHQLKPLHSFHWAESLVTKGESNLVQWRICACIQKESIECKQDLKASDLTSQN